MSIGVKIRGFVTTSPRQRGAAEKCSTKGYYDYYYYDCYY